MVTRSVSSSFGQDGDFLFIMNRFLFSLNFYFTADNIIGAVFMFVAVVFAFFTDFVVKLFTKSENAQSKLAPSLKFTAIALAAVGALLIIN